MRHYMRLLLSLAAVAVFMWILSLFGFNTKIIIEATLLAMTPLALAAIGESLNEKAGTVNIGLEGIFLISALTGVYVAEVTGNGVIGLLGGALVGAFIGFVFGVLSVYGRGDQIIAGMGINIFALGFVPYSLMALWGTPGIRIPPREVLVPPIDTPLISISGVTILTIFIAIAAHYILHRTKIGLWIKAAGEMPEALDVAGVRVDLIRISASTVGGMLAGLGGAFMPLAWFGGIVKEISAGRGFIALACLVSAGLEPILALGFAFVFGFAESIAFTVAVTPGYKEAVPYHLILMIPYITTLVIVAIFIGKRRFPRALATPYSRE